MIWAPPFDAGASKLTAACPSPAPAETPTAAPGGAMYKTVLTAEAVLMPSFAVQTIVREPPAVVVPLKVTPAGPLTVQL